eukprot:CFRG5951T1
MEEIASDRTLRQASDRVVDTPSERLLNLSEDMFEKVSKYVRAELEQPVHDFELIEKINSITALRYSEMADKMALLNGEVLGLFEKYADVAVSIEQINEVESGVTLLENAVNDLELYTQRLEEKINAVVAGMKP